jgi:hypothetical protein
MGATSWGIEVERHRVALGLEQPKGRGESELLAQGLWDRDLPLLVIEQVLYASTAHGRRVFLGKTKGVLASLAFVGNCLGRWDITPEPTDPWVCFG